MTVERPHAELKLRHFSLYIVFCEEKKPSLSLMRMKRQRQRLARASRDKKGMKAAVESMRKLKNAVDAILAASGAIQLEFGHTFQVIKVA